MLRKKTKMAALKVCSLIFVSEVDRQYYVIRIGLIKKSKKRKFMKKISRKGFSDDKVVGGASTPTFKLEKDSIVHIEIAGKVEPRKMLEDKGQYLLSVKNSGVWRDFVVGPGQTDNLLLVDVILRRDSDSGPFLHSAVLNLSNTDTEVKYEVPSPERRSLRLHAVDVSTQTELHVAYSEATYMLKPPTGDTLRRKINLRREVAKVSPSPSGSFSIRLDGVDEEADQVVGPNSGQNVNPQGQDFTKNAHDKLLSSQSLLKLVHQMAPAEAFRLTVGLGVPDVKKKQEEHQEKNVVTSEGGSSERTYYTFGKGRLWLDGVNTQVDLSLSIRSCRNVPLHVTSSVSSFNSLSARDENS